MKIIIRHGHRPLWMALALGLGFACSPKSDGVTHEEGGTATAGDASSVSTSNPDSSGGSTTGGASSEDSSSNDDGSTTDSDGTDPPWTPHCDGLPAPVRSTMVASLDELAAQLDEAQPGDEIVLLDGTYTNDSVVSWTVQGTQDAPIVVRAESILGATIEGAAGFEIQDSDHLVVCGLRFTHATTGGSPADGLVVRSSRNVRVTRNLFELVDSGYAHWLVITGADSADNRIDHNTFQHKSHEGLFIGVYGSSDQLSQRDTIDHNHFYDHFFPEEGGESIRIGDSARQMLSAHTQVESNLFEDCHGDVETVSNKASDVAYRYNTFNNSLRGSLTLRHGHRTTVQSNYFVGPHNGIRMYGNDHVIVGNYFDATTGTGSNAPIAIGSGDSQDGYNGHGGHDTAENILIAFNTLAGNAAHIDIGTSGHDGPEGQPRAITIANNIIVGDDGTAVRQITEFVDFVWEGNLVWGDLSIGVMPQSGYDNADPELVREADGVLRLAAGSPAIDAAVEWPTYASMVSHDMDGQAREDAGDIGADERSSNPVVRGPLIADDVGPLAR